jgi:hypothetical protein
VRTRITAVASLIFVVVAWGEMGSLLQQARLEAADTANPMEGSVVARRAGAKLYARECAACHGAKREGRGKAPSLGRSEVYQATSGTLFWALRNGRCAEACLRLPIFPSRNVGRSSLSCIIRKRVRCIAPVLHQRRTCSPT